jgi:hypothetical protein
MVGTMSQSLRIALYTWAQAVEVAGVARRAWLITPPATAQLPLDDPVSGYACTTLDLGAPNIREVKNPAPDRMGTIDRTAFYADRVVTATMVAWPGGTVTMDDCLRKFEAACHPLNRPELHWTEESALGEKMLTLRVVSMPATFIHPDHLDFQLQWVASDPVVRSVIVNIVTNGVTGGPWPTNAFATPTSNLRTWPKLVLHGPYTGSGAKVALQTGGGPTNLAPTTFTFTLSASAPNLTAGHTVTFDAVARTITDDAGTDYIANGYINWAQTTMGWPVILPGCYATPQMTLTGTDPANTRLDVSWQESYLS